MKPSDQQLESFAGPLHDCPASPNCICSQATRPPQQLPPLEFTGTAAEVIDRVINYVLKMPRTELVSRRSNYAHFTFRSLILRFVDDVEFFADAESGQLHFRSASRLGYSDLGANRRRMQAISTALSTIL